MLKIQQYKKAETLEEAYELLSKNRNNQIIAGMLWLKMEDRIIPQAIDLELLHLDQIEEDDEKFTIGAGVTLRTLEDDGYVTRTVYPEVPPRVEYALTPRAYSLLPHINALIEWALKNKDSIMADRKRSLKTP